MIDAFRASKLSNECRRQPDGTAATFERPDSDHAVDFRVLGPFEVCVGGRIVDLGGAKQQVVIVALVLQAGTSVSNDELADAVWGDAPPRNARRTVQLYITRLRGILAGVSVA